MRLDSPFDFMKEPAKEAECSLAAFLAFNSGSRSNPLPNVVGATGYPEHGFRIALQAEAAKQSRKTAENASVQWQI
jgi:hypothetical protein